MCRPPLKTVFSVTKIAGASYEGFYYICYDKSKGVIEGYYYSKDSEPNQYINLKMIKKYSSSVFKFMWNCK